MTLLEKVLRDRAEAQEEYHGERVYCHCGCGVWWHRPKKVGHPQWYKDRNHHVTERARRWRVRYWARKRAGKGRRNHGR